jgi:hypothetical protein
MLTGRYFPVLEEESTDRRKSRQESAFEKAVVTFKQKEAESFNTVHQSIGDNKLSVRTPWLGATKWLERFVGANMTTLSELAGNAKGKRDYLSVVEKEIGDLMNECHAGLRDLKSREWDRILFWLRSTNETVIHSKPLSVYIQQKTVQTYSAYWQRFSCFCLRAIDDPSCQPGGINHGFNFTDEQRELLMSLKSCYQFVDGSAQGPGIRRSKLLEWSMSCIRQEVHIVGVPVLVYFAGILGYEAGSGQWKQPVHYTNILSGLIWCMRVLVLQYALPMSQRKDFRGGPSLSPIEKFKGVRDKCLVEEVDCPFSSFVALRNYGMTVAKDSVGEDRVRWSDDGQILLFWGHMTSMGDWKSFVLDLLEEAEVMLANQLLFQGNGTLPDVNIWEVRDDHRQSKMGYYFASERSGGWDGARKQMGEWIRKAKDPLGLMGDEDEDGVQGFVQTAVDKYNALDVAFRIILYLLILFTAGSPPRGTEMTAMKFMNSRDGDRDIKATLGRMMLVTAYHKSIGITGTSNVFPLTSLAILTVGDCKIPSAASGQTTCSLPAIRRSFPQVSERNHVGRGTCVFVW